MYYVFERNTKPRRWIDDEPFITGVSFLRGTMITKAVPTPLEYTLKHLNSSAENQSPYLPATLGTRIPLFRNDLVTSLMDCGVNNLDLYDSVIKDPDNGQLITAYKAVNIIGLISAADMSKSSATIHGGTALIDVDFDTLSVDTTKAQGALMFRLAESITTVLVHQRVRNHLISCGFDDLAFYEPGEVAL